MDHSLEGKKILFIAGTLGQGGAERQLFYLASNLKTIGIEVSILCLTRGEYWEEKIKKIGVEVSYIGIDKSPIKRVKKILHYSKQFNPDLIFSMHFYCNAYAGIAGLLNFTPSCGSVRNYGKSEMENNGLFMGLFNMNYTKYLLANSYQGVEFSRKKRINKNNLYFFPNVIQGFEFKEKVSSINGEIKLLSIGRLEKGKRFDRLLNVAKALKEQNLAFSLSIAGSGRLKDELIRKRNALGLQKDVNFLGKVDDVQELYDTHDIFLLTSDHEGTPNVLLEAMSCGTPVVTAKFQGVELILDNKINGIICETIPEFVKAVELLSKDSEIRKKLIFNAKEKVNHQYSFENQLKILSKLLK